MNQSRPLTHDQVFDLFRVRGPVFYRWFVPKRSVPPEGYWSVNRIIAKQMMDFLAAMADPYSAANVVADTVAKAVHNTFGAPTWHVGRDLAGALLRTMPPMGLPLEKFKLPFPSIQLVFEKNACILEDGREVCGLLVSQLHEGEYARVPADVLDDGELLIRDHVRGVEHAPWRAGLENYRMPLSALNISVAYASPAPLGQREMSNGGMTFNRSVKPGQATLNELLTDGLGLESDFGAVLNQPNSTPARSFGDNHANAKVDLVTLLTVSVNAAVLLAAKPEYAEGGELVRPASKKGARIVDALYQPRFLGRKFAYPRGTLDRSLTGRRLPPGWRAGHWKDIAYGEGRSLRRHDWICPYQIGMDQVDNKPR